MNKNLISIFNPWFSVKDGFDLFLPIDDKFDSTEININSQKRYGMNSSDPEVPERLSVFSGVNEKGKNHAIDFFDDWHIQIKAYFTTAPNFN